MWDTGSVSKPNELPTLTTYLGHPNRIWGLLGICNSKGFETQPLSYERKQGDRNSAHVFFISGGNILIKESLGWACKKMNENSKTLACENPRGDAKT